MPDNFDMEETLRLVSDMQNFDHEPDELDDVIGDELELGELDMVAAAASNPSVSFRKFQELLDHR